MIKAAFTKANAAMMRLKEVGVLGATAVLAGGAAYLIWNYTSSCRERNPEPLPEGGEGEERRKEQVVPVAAAPVAAAAAPNAEVTSPDSPSWKNFEK